MANTALLEITDGVATLTLNRPAALNALSVEMMQDLNAAARTLVARKDVAVVVIAGAGEHFMAGGDLKDFAAHLHLSPEARLVTFKAMIEQWINPTVEILQGLPQPVVAKVRGACAGFGLSLMMGCDLVVAADSSVFTTAYSSIALSGDGGVSYLLPRIVGARKAAELLLLADRFDAAEATRLGLVNRVVASDVLDVEVDKLVARLKNGPRHTYGEIKRLLHASFETRLEAQLESEAEAFARCSATHDFGEGVTAFLEKRKPGFRGG
ncbi:enoyl-CoA hydratase/isomerase family protein [Cognatazoarcus halotolerans]|uniref:enoyl-CoA hydratase/isomerase family protein n=1 Tax=Cognatazoarcus halotolerans TaxID=2686016 RepID=UPI0013567E55|nr:enoyl-CoA hydratase-related protein [Cognatazoarcus halotolerans]MBX3679291.1 enoyl-CoA hydratase/isomerase family protein [Rhodocyclaceae bacterium]MCB1899259.1 enoyl-CoA hydratase/isomerase family protein [Rhodocyclaceae bacterium]MCP5310818.1 enoyl-CoA hydratase/isomerase family protein [Zoogloeaceae bacterium]